MAVMTDADRQDTAFAMMRLPGAVRGSHTGVLKADLHAAVAATDQWISDNTASFNAALPAAARANLTPAQKTRLFVMVAEKRREVL